MKGSKSYKQIIFKDVTWSRPESKNAKFTTMYYEFMFRLKCVVILKGTVFDLCVKKFRSLNEFQILLLIRKRREERRDAAQVSRLSAKSWDVLHLSLHTALYGKQQHRGKQLDVMYINCKFLDEV